MITDRSAHVHPRRRGLRSPWGLLLLGLATAVIAGILAMHVFSMGHHGPADAPTTHGVVSADHGAQPAPADMSHAVCPADTCDGPGAMSTMCLFVLLSLALTLPGRGGLSWRWQPPWVSASRRHPPVVRDVLSRVSLIGLCISRT